MYMVTSNDKGMHFREDGSLFEKQQFSSQLQNHRCSEMLEICRAEQKKLNLQNKRQNFISAKESLVWSDRRTVDTQYWFILNISEYHLSNYPAALSVLFLATIYFPTFTCNLEKNTILNWVNGNYVGFGKELFIGKRKIFVQFFFMRFFTAPTVQCWTIYTLFHSQGLSQVLSDYFLFLDAPRTFRQTNDFDSFVLWRFYLRSYQIAVSF